ncbi:hypothetical protein Nepgr_026907 [Nepenthes gracilis]|uniref:Uncharacterized protein n=1 Tax=Nepenthes gracilis TaxID=150966 RepID=A0AAD3Y2K0_NEPGR|nr:hypothetical protein Nepgr_026907 [Nepenthes gracilis]
MSSEPPTIPFGTLGEPATEESTKPICAPTPAEHEVSIVATVLPGESAPGPFAALVEESPGCEQLSEAQAESDAKVEAPMEASRVEVPEAPEGPVAPPPSSSSEEPLVCLGESTLQRRPRPASLSGVPLSTTVEEIHYIEVRFR